MRSITALRLPAALLLAMVAAGPAVAQTAVVTHHFDAGRTGWNPNETVLTPANVSAPGSFGLLATVPLDGRADAQPLVVPNIKIQHDPHMGQHDVVYVGTENNTVYAIDPIRGTVLNQRNLGAQVNQPIGCNLAVSGLGIQGTPVIDVARHAMYVMAYTMEGATPTYTLHMLDLSSFLDKVPPVVVEATQALTNGTLAKFNASVERQRPALLEANNTIYAAFGSFCDFNGDARGWLLGWKAGNLHPIVRTKAMQPTGLLTNRLATAPGNVFLTSIWMSGAGPAADDSAVYFVTANADASGTTYDGVNNIQHSVVKLSQNTMTRLDLFTPYNVAWLDQTDTDFGSGGVMLLPSLGAGVPPMATAQGKMGTLYLLNRDNLGGFTPGGPDNVLASGPGGRCVCAQSYFAAPTPTVVSSGQNQLILWHIKTTPSITMTRYAWTGQLASGTSEDTSFFTAVSSNGGDVNSTIVWTVMRPTSTTNPTLQLDAYNAIPANKTNLLTQLYTAPAGSWAGAHTTANISPVVANGRVYVASNGQLAIFGLLPTATAAATAK